MRELIKTIIYFINFGDYVEKRRKSSLASLFPIIDKSVLVFDNFEIGFTFDKKVFYFKTQ